MNCRLRSSVMDIKAFLQCKKLRRSHRLETKEKSESTVRMELGSLGHFSVLPLELKFLILRYLTSKIYIHEHNSLIFTGYNCFYYKEA